MLTRQSKRSKLGRAIGALGKGKGNRSKGLLSIISQAASSRRVVTLANAGGQAIRDAKRKRRSVLEHLKAGSAHSMSSAATNGGGGGAGAGGPAPALSVTTSPGGGPEAAGDSKEGKEQEGEDRSGWWNWVPMPVYVKWALPRVVGTVCARMKKVNLPLLRGLVSVCVDAVCSSLVL